MHVSEPGSIVMSPSMAAVIRVLAAGDTRFGIREIARLAGLQHSTARGVLDRLAEHGLVLTERAGRSVLCSLNREHLAAGPVVSLAMLRTTLLRYLREDISSWEVHPTHASLFGSTARKDGDTSSDIDVLLIRPGEVPADEPAWELTVSNARDRWRRATGNAVAFVELSLSELRDIVAADEPIVESWRTDAVHLAGERFQELLGRLQ